MHRKPSQLTTKSKRRNGEKIGGGAFKSERNYLDFVIDGTSLGEIVSNAGHDLVSVFTKEWIPEEREKSLRRLLLLEPADFPKNRRSIMVCAECGDLGCGAVSVLSNLREKNSFGVTSVTKTTTKKYFTSMDLGILDHSILNHGHIKRYSLLPCCSLLNES
jgi:hypothetical protein